MRTPQFGSLMLNSTGTLIEGSVGHTRFYVSPLRPEPAPVFSLLYEGLDHLSVNEVAVELIQLAQPEVEAVVV